MTPNPTTSRGTNSGYGLRGYRTSGTVREVILVAAGSLAWWFADAYSGSLLRDALMAALVPVGFLMVFGFGYASDTLPKRLVRFGRARETPTMGLVLMFFLLAVLTVALILTYLAVGEGESLCVGFSCNLEVPVPGVDTPWRPLVMTHVRLGKLATAGVGLLLAGSVLLLHALLRPREHDYSLRLDLRRIGGRVLDVMILLVVTVGLFLLRAEVNRWLLVAMFVLLPFLYEVLPWVLPRFRRWRWLPIPTTSGGGVARGKWWPWLRIAPTGDGADTVAKWRFVVRSLVSSFVFSFGVDLAVVFSVATIAYEPWLLLVRIVLVLSMAAATVHPRGQGLHDAMLGTHVRSKYETVESEVDGSQQGLRLRPWDLADGDIGLAAVDLLDRGIQVEIVSGVLRRDSGPAVVMVNAPWGAGKTTFLGMCAAELRKDALVVEFNSWTQQYTRHPLSDLVSAISYRLQSTEDQRAEALTLEEMIESLTGCSVSPVT